MAEERVERKLAAILAVDEAYPQAAFERKIILVNVTITTFNRSVMADDAQALRKDFVLTRLKT